MFIVSTCGTSSHMQKVLTRNHETEHAIYFTGSDQTKVSFPFKMIRSLKWVKSSQFSSFKEPKFLAATFLFHPQLLNLTAFWRKVKLSRLVLREVVIPPQPLDESLGSDLLVPRSQHSWQFDGELPEAMLLCMWCGRHKRGCSGECESSAWLLLPTPDRAGAKGQLCSQTWS